MINPDIRDQAYQFFIEEASELLQIIEVGLLSLKEERGKPQVHELMRAAHSLKGGAASVELDTIKNISHRLEDIFKAFYDESVQIDTELESLLLEAYDCLKDPLTEQIRTGSFDEAAALARATPIFSQIETLLGESLAQGGQYLPSSADLGIDIVTSIFEIDVAEGLERLTSVVAHPQNCSVADELRAQAEVFAGFAELLNLPGFGSIAQTAIAALEINPTQALSIAQEALRDFQTVREQVLNGDRQPSGASAALLALAEPGEERGYSPMTNEAIWQAETPLSLDDLFSSLPEEMSGLEEEIFNPPCLDEVFGVASNAQAQSISDPPSLHDVFGTVVGEIVSEDLETTEHQKDPKPPTLVVGSSQNPKSKIQNRLTLEEMEAAATLEATIQSVEAIFEQLPSLEELADPLADINSRESLPPQPATLSSQETITSRTNDTPNAIATNLSVRVDFNRLERMNNLVGELAINRNSLSLQNEQLQGGVKELLHRFLRFQEMTGKLRGLSDQMLIDSGRWGQFVRGNDNDSPAASELRFLNAEFGFDALEMDSYGTLYSSLQGLLEEMMQLEESVDDIVLFARTSNQTIEQQRQMLTSLRDELMWARMLPLGEVLNRFPRVLRDLSTTYDKSVKLKLIGTGVLVDKAALEKLNDPLLHLLRNAFDHGIEAPEQRQQQGKSLEGEIEIRAYHQGNQTIIEISDDGQGLNFEKIAQVAIKSGLLTPEQSAAMSKELLADLIFAPGFSTASQVSELSGRGVGLDVVRSQLRSLKGTVTVMSTPGKGATFTLRLPLTLTIAKLLVCLIAPDSPGNATAVALPSDNIAEIIMPQEGQIKKSGSQRFLHWQEQIIPIYSLIDLLDYRAPFPETFSSKSLSSVPTPEDWGLPLLLLRRRQQLFALEVTRLVTEQELVIKPFGSAIAPPGYTYGCTILGDGTLIPVINGAILLEQFLDPSTEEATTWITPEKNIVESHPALRASHASTILVVDDSTALRRTLALTLEKSGYRVLQAKDGREALEKLQTNAGIQLVICDIEMPNMNGFEFLGQRRRDPNLLQVPVAMLTSRSSDKHRQLALQLGANAYFSKPYIEQPFLTAIATIIRQPSAQATSALR